MLRATLILGILLLTSAFACAQNVTNPQVPEDAFSTRELIAWSSLQKPQPTPQPLPPADKPVPEPDGGQRHGNPSAPPSADSQPSPGDAFVGRIAKSGEGYVLT